MTEPVLDPGGGATNRGKPRKKKLSRQDRWIKAANEAESFLNQAFEALEELKAVQEEYIEWRDNLPENLQGSAVGEKLDTVCDLDIDGMLSEVEQTRDNMSEAQSMDMPQGFGRD